MSESTRSGEIPFTTNAIRLEAAARNMTGRPRHSSVSAYVHLRKAWRLMPHDAEMAHFRAITAEEEAASAVIFALKERGYDDGNKLDAHRHLHKAAVFPFLWAVAPIATGGFGDLNASLHLDVDHPRFDVRIPLPGDFVAQPDNPLNFFATRDGTQDFIDSDIRERLTDIAKGEGFSTILAYVKKNANERNRLLYADKVGYPVAKPNDQYILDIVHRVDLNVALTIVIMQSFSKQVFIVECLKVFLRLVVEASKSIVLSRKVRVSHAPPQ